MVNRHRLFHCGLVVFTVFAAVHALAQDANTPTIEVAMTPATPAPKLLPCAYQPLPLGAIRPQGWLLNQLRIQADGLSGHLDEFWPDIKQKLTGRRPAP